MLYVVGAKYLDDYIVELTFNDGKKGKVDLQEVIFQDHRKIFAELKDINEFKKFKIDFNTIVWSNNLDLAPEFLYFQAFKEDLNLQEQFVKWGYVKKVGS